MNENEYYTYEDRVYENPTLTRDETLSFVDSLRDTVNKDNANITRQTQRLGTDVTPNLGGLTGSEGYFAQRYQTAPVEYQVNTLKATAQADALNKLMTNYKNQTIQKYNNAYSSSSSSSSSGSGGTGKSSGGTDDNSSEDSDDKNSSTWDGENFVHDVQNSKIDYTYAYKVPSKEEVKVYIDNSASENESNAAKSRFGQGSSGQTRKMNGIYYVWSDYGQYGPTWYRVKVGL